MVGKTIEELTVRELRYELGERGLVTTGNKLELSQRLRDAIQEEGGDVEDIFFDMAEAGPSAADPIQEALQALLETMEENRKEVRESRKEIQEGRQEVKQMEERMQNSQGQMESRLQDSFKSELDNVREDLGQVQTQVDDMEQRILRLENGRSEVSSRSGTSSFPQGVTIRVKPPTFDGQTSWPVFRKQFEVAARANQWSESEMAASLVMALRGQAAELLQSIPVDEHLGYERLVRSINLRYGDEHLQQVYRTQLRYREQKSSETLQQLQVDVERLANLAYSYGDQNFLNEVATEAFVNAISDRDLQQALRLAAKKTTAEALAFALTYESAKNASRSAVRVRQVAVEEEVERSPRRQILDGPVCWECERRGHIQRNCPRKQPRSRSEARSLRCYGCGEEGHLKNTCKKARRVAFEDDIRCRTDGGFPRKRADSPVESVKARCAENC